MDKELEDKINELEAELKSFKRGLTVVIAVSILFIIIFQAFSIYSFINGLPIDKLDLVDEIFDRCEEIDCVDRIFGQINTFPKLPYYPYGEPDFEGVINESLIIVSDGS